MDIPEYISVEEVRNVCNKLGIRDWTQLEKATVLPNEAKKILSEIDNGGLKIDIENFRIGLEVELEHGIRFPNANVTNNHPLITGMIVLAHFEESLDYYQRLEVAELEGDLLKAIVNKNPAKVNLYYGRLVKAKLTLSKSEANTLNM
ncbi:MAG: hypothetical protein NWF10_06890 [Candidatus Bathyarchaeota archaeon]|jgi:hypothetical protein|nr:hypothetical protein [Candidatus Bathyarchaeota archaeon]